MDKNKQYKTFAFPNRLTPLETYYHYLLEFNVIPSRIPADKVVEIFRHAAEDYLNGLLNTPSFSLLSFDLMIRKELEINLDQYVPGLNRLVGYCGELSDDHKEEIEKTKKLLTLYFFHPKNFAELVTSKGI